MQAERNFIELQLHFEASHLFVAIKDFSKVAVDEIKERKYDQIFLWLADR